MKGQVDWKLGSKCYVRYVCFAAYDHSQNRQLFVENLNQTLKGIVIGRTFICTGKYVKSRGYTEFETYEDARLQVDRRILVYQVKFELTGKVYTVLPENLHKTNQIPSTERGNLA